MSFIDNFSQKILYIARLYKSIFCVKSYFSSIWQYDKLETDLANAENYGRSLIVKYDLVIQYIPILELLFFNLLSIYRCCRRKYSALKTVLTLVLFSVLLFCATYSLLGPSDFRGDGSLYVGGLIYLIPFHFLFKEKFALLLTIVCSCCIYTLGILSLAIQISGVIAPGEPLCTAAVTTVLYLLTIWPFYKKIIPKYIFAIENIAVFEKRWFRIIAVNSCLSFVTLTLLNARLISTDASILNMAVMLLSLVSVFIFYYLFYKVVRDSLEMRKLEREARHDPLTGLRNRTMLWNDLTELLEKKAVFSVLFMDLNRFKQINDQYGHITGDHYLIHFAELSAQTLSDAGQLYRFAGDEFIAVCPGTVSDELVNRLRDCPDWEHNAPCSYNSVSIGTLLCTPPLKDVESILREVDRLMYKQKQN